jgi:Xaa-Pro aminopeptidase
MPRYRAIDPHLFINSRKKLAAALKPNALAVLNANDIMPTNADGLMRFQQNSDIFYLSGIIQEEVKLILYPHAPKPEWREMLFISPIQQEITQWEGQKHTKETAQAASGIESIYFLNDFDKIFRTVMEQAEYVYLNSNEHIRATSPVETRDRRFISWCQQQYPLHTYQRLAPLMHTLRMVKSELEIDLLRRACAITEKGFRQILSFVKPGVAEHEIEAELIREFIRNNADGFAYEPIIATGPNACILHYRQNNQICHDGQTILLDVGAAYANYCADMTRVIPVNGRFSARQRSLYNSLLRVLHQAQTMLVPGNDMATYYQAIGEVMEKELVDLHLISLQDIKEQDPKSPAYKKYFMHGISHHIGLDVHDVANVYAKLQPGMVLTIEPGIYVPEEGVGMRLENNFVIRQNQTEDLMATIPIEADEIEELMQASK